jgi:hypothetical protein
MKRLDFAVLAVTCLAAQSVFASINITPSPSPVADVASVNGTNSWVKFTGGGGGGGGPFTGTLATSSGGLGSSTNTWTTFCVEAGAGVEFFVPGQTMRIESLSDYVTSAVGNTVTEAAKYLYIAYSNSLLTGTGAEYQEAIWRLVKTASSADANVNVYTNSTWLFGAGTGGAAVQALRDAAIAAVTTDADAAANLAATANIRILNPAVVNSPAVPKQSMLYAIPEASTIAVWSVLTLIGAGIAYRKRNVL